MKRYFSEPRFKERSGISAEMDKRVKLILEALDIVESAEEMDIVGLFFHELKGARKGTFSVRVTGNYRITWQMDGKDVTKVNLEDYH